MKLLFSTSSSWIIIIGLCLLPASIWVEAKLSKKKPTATSTSSFEGPQATPLAGPKSMNLLMVGNPLGEDHHLEEMVMALMREHALALKVRPESMFAARFNQGSAKLTDYSANANLRQMLTERQWNFVVLQDQSEVPGFYDLDDNSYWVNSRNAAVTISQKVQAAGAITVLFQTWGYWAGDPHNPGLYPDYETMQLRLSEGYAQYRQAILQDNPTADVLIAPVGDAFRRIYNDQVTQGKDPMKKGNFFENLFDTLEEEASEHSDITTDPSKSPRKYPTVLGSYLAACVFFQVLTGLDVRTTSYVPYGVQPSQQHYLQSMAFATVNEFDQTSSSATGNKPVPPSDSAAPAYVEPPPTTKEYKPYQSSSSGSSSTTSGRKFGSTLLWILVLGGMVAFVINRKTHFIRLHVPGGGRERRYNYNVASTSDDIISSSSWSMPSMELSDYQDAHGGYSGMMEGGGGIMSSSGSGGVRSMFQ